MASQYSGSETFNRAKTLAAEIGALHTSIYIDDITGAIQSTFRKIDVHAPFVDRAALKTEPVMEGGTSSENLALQNIRRARGW